LKTPKAAHLRGFKNRQSLICKTEITFASARFNK